jgi:hypothetical protein
VIQLFLFSVKYILSIIFLNDCSEPLIFAEGSAGATLPPGGALRKGAGVKV